MWAYSLEIAKYTTNWNTLPAVRQNKQHLKVCESIYTSGYSGCTICTTKKKNCPKTLETYSFSIHKIFQGKMTGASLQCHCFTTIHESAEKLKFNISSPLWHHIVNQYLSWCKQRAKCAAAWKSKERSALVDMSQPGITQTDTLPPPSGSSCFGAPYSSCIPPRWPSLRSPSQATSCSPSSPTAFLHTWPPECFQPPVCVSRNW